MQDRLKGSVSTPWRTVDPGAPASGQLIVLEGPDGAGKTTIGREVVRRLTAEGASASFFASPGIEPGSLGKLVHRFSYRPSDLGVTEEVDPLAIQLLHVASHIDSIPRIHAGISAGQIVVLDRCWWSTWVYGIVSDVEPNLLRTVLSLETSYWGGTRPDHLFLLERRGNNELQPPGLVAAYRELAASEAGTYPVTILRNDSSIADAARAVVEGTREHTRLDVKRPVSSGRRSSDRFPQRPVKTQRASIASQENEPQRASMLESFPMQTSIYDAYWRFAAERQAIYFKRLRGDQPPWTADQVLSRFRFTNAYRAADKVSQYLIRNVIYNEELSAEDTVFRILLFKLFNRIDTWEHLQSAFGELRYQNFSIERFTKELVLRAARGGVYSPAYIMPSPRSFGFERKFENHLALLEHMMRDRLTTRVARSRSLRELYEALLSYSGIGPFLAYQYAIDLNYSELTDFSESEFVVAGPGAKNGLRKCFRSLPARSHEAIIQAVCDRQELEFETRTLKFQGLWGRPLQWIDCQNLFCEIDKYARVAHPEANTPGKNVRIKQRYVPGGPIKRPWFPPKWGINDAIERWCGTRDQC